MVIQIADTAEFDKHIKGATLTIVDFYADWCGPCRVVAPRFAQLAEQNPQIKFLKVNVDTCKEVSSREEVRAMPTFKCYKNGSVIKTIVGADIKAIENVIRENSSGSFQSKGYTLSGQPPVQAQGAGAPGNSVDRTILIAVAVLMLYLYMNQQ